MCLGGRYLGKPDVVGGVSPGPPGTRSHASDVRLSYCASATCVRDRARVAGLRRIRRRSRMPGHPEAPDEAHSNRADRRSARKEFFSAVPVRVTTRAVAEAGRGLPQRRSQALLSLTPLALGLGVLRAPLRRGASFPLPLGRLPAS